MKKMIKEIDRNDNTHFIECYDILMINILEKEIVIIIN